MSEPQSEAENEDQSEPQADSPNGTQPRGAGEETYQDASHGQREENQNLNLIEDGAPGGEPGGAAEAVPTVAAAEEHSTQGWPSLVQFVFLVLTIALFINTFLVQAFRIPSGSMENTLLVGDYLMVDKARWAPAGHWSWLLPYQPVRRGEIVVFRYPVDPTEFFVKRVIGVPGDRIHLQKGRVWCNGRALDEPYAVFKDRTPDEYRDDFPRGARYNENLRPGWAGELRRQLDHGELVVPEGKYFVLGDNRDRSLDGRYWGFVPREVIVGRPVLLYFSMAQTPDDDEDEDAGGVATTAADGKLGLLRARISRLLGEPRWRRILRVAP